MMVSKFVTFTLYLLLISTFAQAASSFRIGLDYINQQELENVNPLQNEDKSLPDKNAEKDFPYFSASLGAMGATRDDETPDELKETKKDIAKELLKASLKEKLNSNHKTKQTEKAEPNNRKVLEDDESSVGGEILHIVVIIVIVLVGIGVIIAIIAAIAFLVNYIKRRVNIKGGKRPGSEDILLLDNSHLPTMGSV